MHLKQISLLPSVLYTQNKIYSFFFSIPSLSVLLVKKKRETLSVMETSLASCPADVKQRGLILHSNGFSGFQAPDGPGKDCFGVCMFCDDSVMTDLEVIKKETGSHTLRNDDWIGRDYLVVHWSEHSRIPLILNALLKRGHSFQSMTKGLPSFDAEEDKEFNQAALEKKVMTQAKQLLSYRLVDLIDHALCEPWNYTTEEGKAFSKTLREDPLMWRYDTERTNFYEWTIFTAPYNKETLESSLDV